MPLMLSRKNTLFFFPDQEFLRSVEFFSIPKQEWVSLADMTIARYEKELANRLKFLDRIRKVFTSRSKTRTEHGLAVINGIPTVGPSLLDQMTFD